MAISTHQCYLPTSEFPADLASQFADAQIILAFGQRYLLEDAQFMEQLTPLFEDKTFVICSTSGQIDDTKIWDNGLSITGLSFEHTDIRTAQININDVDDGYEAGKALARALPKEQLSHVLIFSDGHLVNGEQLLEGLNQELPENIKITGGLAGDDARFEKTLVGLNKAPSSGNIIALGLYGDRLQVSFSYGDGFDPFGPQRKITKSDGYKLYELDNKNVLSLYKTYLGELAAELPGSALFFPLSITAPNGIPLVRTILSIDEDNNSMTFAGNVPEGSHARLMRSNTEHLIEGVYKAAENCLADNPNPQFALLISCVGRKLVLDQRAEEETEAVKETLGNIPMTGFYSYGEICPMEGGNKIAGLHNQTMTITTFTEV